MSTLKPKGGVWSATPTPFTPDLRIDEPSVRRLVDRHVEFGIAGLMLAGTCGEGPWMREREREALTRTAVEAAAGRLGIAVQVTDNSAVRVLDQVEKAASWGAQIAVVAAPFFLLNATPARILGHHREILTRSRLPIGFYDFGAAKPNAVPDSHLPELLAEPNLAMVKDSSSSASRRQILLEGRRRSGFALFNGDEFNCVAPIREGYDGLLLGGAIFNSSLAFGIIRAARAGNTAQAEKIQQRMNDLMYRVYGGLKIECWMSGLKELLVRMGVFSHDTNLLGYPLTDECRDQIRAAVDGTDGFGFPADLFGAAVGAAAP